MEIKRNYFQLIASIISGLGGIAMILLKINPILGTLLLMISIAFFSVFYKSNKEKESFNYSRELIILIAIALCIILVVMLFVMLRI